MGTEIRPEISDKSKYWIEKHRYYELKHFCLQYPIWKKAHDALDGLSKRPADLELFVKSGQVVGDPTARCGVARAYYGGLFSRLYRPALRLRIPSPVPLRGGSLPAYRAEIHPLWRRERVLPSLRLKSSTSQKVFTPTAFADAPTRRWTMFPSPSGPDKLMG